ncbi:uncharacterized protein MONOS_3992 [Monocercomonoides exilis]|uniref:uncharacterized protein n=1 Tax=Monocercomonoides exilis TaxID=2049356 RepID=UPI003559CAA5|nr:hypothetical protein MONOS_3992 [Monocercomonoides exilis]|eukprot:MONOS_3992.1-p1 / transcript=MONOS_3992.1 / gene=MONOS_3992 / organism=Monocercomonoides_exilis_PA203 / gene_product=unspecified product / transcript_product=unspecified product / location=Mono_scaffold00100:61280-62835(+) / protein_length=320 / sequence_SO=supercontig / SO=protein_coding / is_pseudo=false
MKEEKMFLIMRKESTEKESKREEEDFFEICFEKRRRKSPPADSPYLLGRCFNPWGNDISWSCDSRFFVSAVCTPRLRVDNLFILFNVKGHRLASFGVETLFDVKFQPALFASAKEKERQMVKWREAGVNSSSASSSSPASSSPVSSSSSTSSSDSALDGPITIEKQPFRLLFLLSPSSSSSSSSSSPSSSSSSSSSSTYSSGAVQSSDASTAPQPVGVYRVKGASSSFAERLRMQMQGSSSSPSSSSSSRFSSFSTPSPSFSSSSSSSSSSISDASLFVRGGRKQNEKKDSAGEPQGRYIAGLGFVNSKNKRGKKKGNPK